MTGRPSERLRGVLSTRALAAQCFDRVAEALGERAYVQRAREGEGRRLFVRTREGAAVVPWPLLTFSVAPEASPREDEPAPSGWTPPAPVWEPETPVIHFDLSSARPAPARFAVFDGAESLAVAYGEDGRCGFSEEPARLDAFEELGAALASATDPMAALVHSIASIDVGRHGPARALLPRDVPRGPDGAWTVARHALRTAMALRKTPPGSFWAVADGYVGSAIAFGASRDEALAAWREEVARVRPQPPGPAEPPPDESPDAIPSAVVRVAAVPRTPPARGAWTRRLGDFGGTLFGLRWPIPGGHTIVGEELLRLADLDTLDATLDALDEQHAEALRGIPRGPGFPPRTHETVFYRCVDGATGLPIAPVWSQSQVGGAFDVGAFDGNLLRTCVVRMRLRDDPDSSVE